jgi:hypothetical protein
MRNAQRRVVTECKRNFDFTLSKPSNERKKAPHDPWLADKLRGAIPECLWFIIGLQVLGL